MQTRRIPRRRLVLAILAAAIPSLALLALGVRLIVQEAKLAETRRVEAREAAYTSFAGAAADVAAGHLDRVVAQIRNNGWGGLDTVTVPLVLAGAVTGRSLALAREFTGTADRFSRTVHAGPFGRALDRGETLEFAQSAPNRAAEAYRTALRTAVDTLQLVYGRLALARTLEKTDQHEESSRLRRDLLSIPPRYEDDYGVPLALYAAEQLTKGGEHLDEVIAVLHPLSRPPRTISPMAAYLFRAVHDSLRAARPNDPDVAELGSRGARMLGAVRLQDDFGSVLPRLESSGGANPWILYAGDEWLLSLAPPDSAGGAVLVALDAGVVAAEAAQWAGLTSAGYLSARLSSTSSAPGRWLGPRFPGVYGLLDARPDGTDSSGPLGRAAFIGLAMVVLIGLTVLAFAFWWRDTQREVAMAKMRSDFVSSVSHELKTPLTSIRMFAETLRYRQPPDRVRSEYLDTIISESGRLSRLLNNVLDFTRIEKGAKTYQMRPIALQDVVYRVLEAMAYPLEAKGFEVATDIADEELGIMGDTDALEQVLINLLANAMKYSDTERHIEIGVRRNGALAECWVRDLGMGIAAADHDRIFGGYYRTESARTRGIPGTGLGLSIARHAVDAHGGRIVVSSTPGAGSTFTVSLPLA